MLLSHLLEQEVRFLSTFFRVGVSVFSMRQQSQTSNNLWQAHCLVGKLGAAMCLYLSVSLGAQPSTLFYLHVWKKLIHLTESSGLVST